MIESGVEIELEAARIIYAADALGIKLRPGHHLFDGKYACAAGIAAIMEKPEIKDFEGRGVSLETYEKAIGKPKFEGLSAGFENPETSTWEYPKKARPWVLVGRLIRETIKP